MPDTGRGATGTCLFPFVNYSGNRDNDTEFVELDPSRRYGRYNEVLGKGACKTVYRAFDEVEGIEVAWNQVKAQDVLRTPEDLQRLYSEVHLLKTLKHRNIIKFHHSWVDTKTNNINFITEIFTSGTLRQYRKRHKHVDINAVKNWSRQILRGLLYLHSHDPPIIHRDLKCDNIFVNGNQGEVKIGDLGLAVLLQQVNAARSVIGTPEFMAPELYEGEYTELVDIYSFGMCLLEMVTSEYPYSECSNAAQIYKKVTSGKRPEGLNKVKDQELRQFIEKCLVTAAERLPARDLLMDPFLHPERGHEAIAFSPHISATFKNDGGMGGLGVPISESHSKVATVKISYIQKETPPNNNLDDKVCRINYSSTVDADVNLGTGRHCQPIPYADYIEEKPGKSVDFRVKCKRRDDDTIFMQLRIADSEGYVRNIHFPFDIEGDTAMCVASEMVAELDLMDQDVTKIAEMIDAAILTLVPEWKPGVSIDDSYGIEEDVLHSHHLSNIVVEDSCLRVHYIFDPLSTVSSESSLAEQPPVCSRLLSTPGILITDAIPSPQIDGTMHGRFEELAYHRSRSEFSSGVEEEHCTALSKLSEVSNGGSQWDAVEESSSCNSLASLAIVAKNLEFGEEPSFYDVPVSPAIVAKSADSALSFSAEFLPEGSSVTVECKDCPVSAVHEVQDDTAFGRSSVDDNSSSVVEMLENDSEFWQQDVGCQSTHLILSSQISLGNSPSFYDNELETQELRMLAVKHEHELRELQYKHKAALLELTKRLRQKKSCRSLTSLLGKGKDDPTFTRCDVMRAMQAEHLDDLQSSDSQNLAQHNVTSQFYRSLSEKYARKESRSDRLSLKEVTAALSQIRTPGGDPFGDIVVNSNDLLSLGQVTPISTLNVASQEESLHVRGYLGENVSSSDCYCTV